MRGVWTVVLLVAFCAFEPSAVIGSELRLIFSADSEDHAAAAREYQAIWAGEGQSIIDEMERRTGLAFRESEIQVVVREEPSYSGWGDQPMVLRASYPSSTKKATLIHELGHRLHGHLFRQREEDHHHLFLYLYDVWVALYGKEFADAEVAVESQRRGYFDYEGAWQEALAMSESERSETWRVFVESRKVESRKREAGGGQHGD